MKTTIRRGPLAIAAALTLLAIVVGAVMVTRTGYASASPDGQVPHRTFDFDVAEDGTRFVFDDAPVSTADCPTTAMGSSHRASSTRTTRSARTMVSSSMTTAPDSPSSPTG